MTASPFTLRAVGGDAAAPEWAEVGRGLGVLLSPGQSTQIHNLPGGEFRHCPGDDPAGRLKAVEELARSGKGVYFNLNPLPDSLDHSATSKDVLRRQWLLVDVDRLDPVARKELNATEADRVTLRSVADAVAEYLTGMGWPAPILVDSGNGWHLYYRIDLPNDKESSDLLRLFLKALSRRFAAAADIDQKVYDARRISKLPGTWARKGPPSEDRPHRLCRVVSVPADDGELVDPDLIARTTRALTAPVPPKPSPFVMRASNDPGPDVVTRAIAYLAECAPAVSGQAGHSAALNAARAVVYGFDLGPEAGFSLLDAHYNPRCQPPWSERELRHKCRQADTVPYEKPRGWLLLEGANGHAGNGAVKPATGKAEPAIRIYSLPDLLAMDIPEPRWAIPGLLSEGLSVLAGKPKLGKSWLALNLALTIAAGGKALGDTQVQPGDVLYLALEDRLRRVKDRATKVLRGLDLHASARLHFAVECPRMDRGGLQAVEGWIASVPRPTLVVIDVWAKYKTVSRGKGNAYEEDYELAGLVKAIGDRNGASILALHHCKKAKAEDVVDEISGTTGLAGCADGLLILTRTRGDYEGNIFLTGRDIDEKELAVSFDPERFTWTSLGNAKMHTDSKIKQQVLAYLRRHPTGCFFAAQIADSIEHPNKESVARTLARMADDGLLQRHGRQYSWPAEEPSTDSEGF